MRARSAGRWWGTVLEAPDPGALARFYSQLLGWPIADEKPGWVTIYPGEGVAYIAFQLSAQFVPTTWPAEQGRQQMTAHLDIEVDDVESAVAEAVTLGARPADHQPQPDVRVMLDPAGHPFCLYRGGDD